MSRRMEARNGNGVASRITGISQAAGPRRLPGLLLVLMLAAVHGSASGQIYNQVTSVSPDSASQGSSGLLVTFALDADSPLAPPAGDGPQSVTIGSVSGTAIAHASNLTVSASFSFPAGEPAGARDVAITFAIPGGTLVFTKAAAFTVTSAGANYTIEQSVSDEAQRNTIAFDGLAFVTGSLGAQSFLPPGKVADFSGFQYLRDNDATNLGHNTDFVTIVAFNMLNILTADQVNQLVASAGEQVQQINEFAYQRYPLLKAFRRQFDGDLPAGTTGLDSSAVVAYTAGLYRLDGQISYRRARLMGGILASLTPAQKASLDALKALNGVGNWNRTLADPLQSLHLDHDVNVAVMTYASEMYSWYAGSVEADTYFCPERHGTYFGSFYLKDWPAMGNPNYTINEQLTASAGQDFLAALPVSQAARVTGLVDAQRSALLEMVERRRDIATQLRRFMTGAAVDSAAILALSARYGELDGQIGYAYATRFSAVAHALSAEQTAAVGALADSLGYVSPAGGFLYSSPIAMPAIANTDVFFFPAVLTVDEGRQRSGRSDVALTVRAMPNPTTGSAAIGFVLPVAGPARVVVHDAAGRVVARLSGDAFAAGVHQVTWHGLDDAGRAVPAGVYFIRIETAVGTRSSKLAVSR